jgi:hypothetical protein
MESSFNSASKGVEYALFREELILLNLPEVYNLVFDCFQLPTWEWMGADGNTGERMIRGVKWVGGYGSWLVDFSFGPSQYERRTFSFEYFNGLLPSLLFYMGRWPFAWLTSV